MAYGEKSLSESFIYQIVRGHLLPPLEINDLIYDMRRSRGNQERGEIRLIFDFFI